MSWRRMFGVWALLVPFMIANGVFRELVLVTAFGDRFANVLSAAMGIAIVLLVTRLFLRRAAEMSVRSLARISIVWLGLTVAFEFLFGHYVDGLTWSELAANYAFWRGRLWPLVLASLAAAPFLWGRTPTSSVATL